MKIILFNAITMNGKIAGKNGNEDFISDKNWDEFCKITNKAGCLIFGRKTFENVKKWEKKYIEKIKAKIIVVSKTKRYDASSLEEAIEIGGKLGYSEIVISGGSNLNKSIWQKNLADELIIDIEPIIVGSGKNLIEEGDFQNHLKLLNVKRIDRGIIQLKYKIIK